MGKGMIEKGLILIKMFFALLVVLIAVSMLLAIVMNAYESLALPGFLVFIAAVSIFCYIEWDLWNNR